MCSDYHVLPETLSTEHSRIKAWLAEKEKEFCDRPEVTYRVFYADLKEVISVPATSLAFTRGLFLDPSDREKRPASLYGNSLSNKTLAIAQQAPTACGLYAVNPAHCKWGKWCNQAHVQCDWIESRRQEFDQWSTNLLSHYQALPSDVTFMVHDPTLRSVLHVPKGAVKQFTRGLLQGSAEKCPSVCLLDQNGRCTAGTRCNQAHVANEWLAQQRQLVHETGRLPPPPANSQNAAASFPPPPFRVDEFSSAASSRQTSSMPRESTLSTQAPTGRSISSGGSAVFTASPQQSFQLNPSATAFVPVAPSSPSQNQTEYAPPTSPFKPPKEGGLSSTPPPEAEPRHGSATPPTSGVRPQPLTGVTTISDTRAGLLDQSPTSGHGPEDLRSIPNPAQLTPIRAPTRRALPPPPMQREGSSTPLTPIASGMPHFFNANDNAPDYVSRAPSTPSMMRAQDSPGGLTFQAGMPPSPIIGGQAHVNLSFFEDMLPQQMYSQRSAHAVAHARPQATPPLGPSALRSLNGSQTGSSYSHQPYAPAVAVNQEPANLSFSGSSGMNLSHAASPSSTGPGGMPSSSGSQHQSPP